jgi:predicted Zn-dependent protease
MRPTILAFCLLLLTHAGSLPTAHADLALPDLGDPSERYLSAQQAQSIAHQVKSQLRAQGLLLEDALTEHYLEQLAARFRRNAVSELAQTRLDLFLIRSPEINAFALPGGAIGFNSGLIALAEEEDHFAGVVAHEIAHVTQKHHTRAAGAQGNTALQTAGLLLAAILLGSQDPELAEAAVYGGIASQAQGQINYTRQNEYEADRIGIDLLAQANFDPQGMAEFFDRLQKASHFAGLGTPEFLRTHPVTSARVAEARDRAESLGPPRGTPTISADARRLDYPLFRTRVRVLATQHADRLRRELETQVQEGDRPEAARLAARYGLALLALRQERPPLARDHLEQTPADFPGHIWWTLTQARAELAGVDPQAGLDRLSRARRLYPNYEPLIYRHVEALLSQGAPKEALSLLRKHQQSLKEQPRYLKLLANVYHELESPAAAHEYLARFHRENRTFFEALQQIELGLDSEPAPSDIRRARLQTLRHEIQSTIRSRDLTAPEIN